MEWTINAKLNKISVICSKIWKTDQQLNPVDWTKGFRSAMPPIFDDIHRETHGSYKSRKTNSNQEFAYEFWIARACNINNSWYQKCKYSKLNRWHIPDARFKWPDASGHHHSHLICHVFRILKLKSFQHWRPPHGDRQMWTVWSVMRELWRLTTDVVISPDLPRYEFTTLPLFLCYYSAWQLSLSGRPLSNAPSRPSRRFAGRTFCIIRSGQPKILHTIPKSAGSTSRLIWRWMILRLSGKTVKAGKVRWHR